MVCQILDAARSLAGVEQRQGNAPVWRCDGCGAANPNAVGMCQACGATRPFAIGGRRHEIATAAGDLAEITWEWLHGIEAAFPIAIVNSRFTEAEVCASTRWRMAIAGVGFITGCVNKSLTKAPAGPPAGSG